VTTIAPLRPTSVPASFARPLALPSFTISCLSNATMAVRSLREVGRNKDV